MNNIPDFNTDELEVIDTVLNRRYGQKVEIQLADSEVKLDPATPVLTVCPTVYWEVDKVSFVVFKTAADCYRCQFFYSDLQPYGTGMREYHNLSECVMNLLRVQADHALDRKLYG